jgi:TolB-like protein/DNA-binding winged helix-turn-helix (wHTH) protein
MNSARSADRIRFGVFEIDLHSRELRKQGVRIKLQDLPFRLLLCLVERPGELVTREELRSALWPTGAFVDFERGLGTAMNKVRDALGDAAGSPRFIETIPRRGYRFLASVERIGTAPDGLESGTSSPQPSTREAQIPRKGRPRLGRAGWLVAGVALALAIFAFGWMAWRSGAASRASRGPIRALAVLPLDNLSGDPSQDYFADGITEELTTELAKIRVLRVTSHTSAKQFQHSGKSLPQIARLLGVDGVLEGAVLRSGSHVKITAQLVRAPTDEHLWAQTYDRDLGDLISSEEELARDIAGEIRIQLSAIERSRLENARRVAPEVHEAYLKGRDQWNRRTPVSLSEALQLFQTAIQKDPSYAPAYAGLADTYAILGAAGYDIMPESVVSHQKT